ncbi:MAG: hypothetical protein P4M02_05725, partial [Clostridia bacterium]|nr:hypothetical protein [Clostridia bacterium]
MTNRDRTMAVLHYKDHDRLPIVYFGFWKETLAKWSREGHVTEEEAKGWADGNEYDFSVAKRLGLDYNWAGIFKPPIDLFPAFEVKLIRDLGNGARHVRDEYGAVVLQ